MILFVQNINTVLGTLFAVISTNTGHVTSIASVKKSRQWPVGILKMVLKSYDRISARTTPT